MVVETTKGYVGASWWKLRRGVWNCSAHKLGGKSYVSTIRGNKKVAEKEAYRLLSIIIRGK